LFVLAIGAAAGKGAALQAPGPPATATGPDADAPVVVDDEAISEGKGRGCC
jgi:hypothetical protein